MKEVKPYRDTFPQRNEDYNIAKPMKQPDLFRKNQQIGRESEKNVVTNPALTLARQYSWKRARSLNR